MKLQDLLIIFIPVLLDLLNQFQIKSDFEHHLLFSLSDNNLTSDVSEVSFVYVCVCVCMWRVDVSVYACVCVHVLMSLYACNV